MSTVRHLISSARVHCTGSTWFFFKSFCSSLLVFCFFFFFFFFLFFFLFFFHWQFTCFNPGRPLSSCRLALLIVVFVAVGIVAVAVVAAAAPAPAPVVFVVVLVVAVGSLFGEEKKTPTNNKCLGQWRGSDGRTGGTLRAGRFCASDHSGNRSGSPQITSRTRHLINCCRSLPSTLRETRPEMDAKSRANQYRLFSIRLRGFHKALTT